MLYTMLSLVSCYHLMLTLIFLVRTTLLARGLAMSSCMVRQGFVMMLLYHHLLRCLREA